MLTKTMESPSDKELADRWRNLTEYRSDRPYNRDEQIISRFNQMKRATHVWNPSPCDTGDVIYDGRYELAYVRLRMREMRDALGYYANTADGELARKTLANGE